MKEYLINVAFGMTTVSFAFLVVMFFGFLFRKFMNKKHENVYKWFIEGCVFAWVISIILVVVDSSITYKHETFDKTQDQHTIDMYNRTEYNDTEIVIKDISKPIEGVSEDDFEKLVDYDHAE